VPAETTVTTQTDAPEPVVSETAPLQIFTAPECTAHRFGYRWALSVPRKHSEVIWLSSDPSVVSVTEDGYVTANGNGQAVICALSGDVRYDFPFRIDAVSWDLLGDVNLDGEVDLTDAQVLLQVYVKGLVTGVYSGLSEEQTMFADVNDDGLINAADAQGILQFYVNKVLVNTDRTAENIWLWMLM